MPLVPHLIEVAAVSLAAWAWVQVRAQGRQIHHELVIAAVYGWLLEALDMRIFGTYHYGPGAWWWLADVPLYIPVLWAVIVHSSMALSDRAGLPEWARPFLDGLLAVLIDLAVDAIAIRLGLWRWTIRLDEGWFGVPPGNLCAWMWVAGCYSGAMRMVRARISQRGEPAWHRWLVPLVAYAWLFGILMLIGWTGRMAGLDTQNERLWLFVWHVAAFLLVVFAAAGLGADSLPAKPVPISLLWSRWAIHGSFFLLLWLTGLWRAVPALVGVSLGSMMLEWAAQRWCATGR